MNTLSTAAQLAGLIAVLCGLYIILSFGWFLLVAGAAVLAAGVLMEVVVLKRSIPARARPKLVKAGGE